MSCDVCIGSVRIFLLVLRQILVSMLKDLNGIYMWKICTASKEKTIYILKISAPTS